MSKLHREAIREVQNEIVQIIRDYVEDLKMLAEALGIEAVIA